MLPCHPHPKDDEILSSWMVRLAVANRFKLHSFYVKLLQCNKPIWTRDIDRYQPPELLEVLSKHTGHSVQCLQEMTLHAYEGILLPQVPKNTGESFWIIPLGVFHRMRRRDGMQFCPLCLCDDGPSPYFRRQWRLALACRCEQHGCLLHSHCPNCGQPIAYFRHDLNHLSASTNAEMATCWQCHFDLRDSVVIYPSYGSELSDWLQGVMDVFNPRIGFAWTSSGMSLSYYQGISILMRVISCTHGAELRRYLLKEIGFPCDVEAAIYRHLFSELSPNDRLGLLLAVGYLLQDWPQRFVTCCRGNHVRRSNFIELFREMPWWLYQEVIWHFDGRVYMFSAEEIASAVRYLEQRGMAITIRNLRSIIGMTQNAAVAVRNAYRRSRGL